MALGVDPPLLARFYVHAIEMAGDAELVIPSLLYINLHLKKGDL